MALSKPKIPVGGLATGPNDLDKPAGDFLVAENVVHRRDGILEPLPGENYYMESSGAQYSRVFSDWEPQYWLKLRKLDADSFAQLSTEQLSATPVYPAKFLPGETQCVYTDGRHILSGAEYNVVVDNIDLGSYDPPRRAGLPQLGGIVVNARTVVTSTSLQPTVEAHKAVEYTAIVKRRLRQSRFIQSAPTNVVVLDNTAAAVAVNPTLKVLWDSSFGQVVYQPGDQILIFRTSAQDTVAEVNASFYLAVTYTLTSGDISAGFVVVQDNTLQDNLGEELYTNPGAQGALKANIVPPRSSGVETYLGTTFYINKQTQPAVNLTIAGTFGISSAAGVTSDADLQLRKNGIGQRSFIGDVTSASPNITNVQPTDAVGLAVGQIITTAGFSGGPGAAVITAITPGFLYTVTVSRNAATTGTLSHTAVDAATITATKDGASVTSAPFSIANGLVTIQSLLALHQPTAALIPGFVASFSGPLDLNYSISAQAQINFAVTSPDQWDSFQIKVSNPDNFAEGSTVSGMRQIDSIQETRRNVAWYSKTNLPEDVSPIQFILIGSGTVYRLLNTQSCMLAFCSDGLFKVQGEGDNWIITPVDTTARLVHPDCAVAAGQVGFAWLEKGFSAVSETGAEIISQDAIGPDLQEITRQFYALGSGPHNTWGPCVVLDRANRDVWLNIVQLPDGEAVHKYATYLFNTETGKFTTAGNTYTALSYFPSALTVIRAKTGFFGTGLYRPSVPPSGLFADYLPATVVYLPFVENAGEVKQWVDVNYFFDNVPETDTGVYNVEALFGGELTSSTNLFELNASQAPGVLFALHALVPRRVARGVELVVGFRTSMTPDDDHPSGGYYFQFKGASVRVRVASQTIKR